MYKPSYDIKCFSITALVALSQMVFLSWLGLYQKMFTILAPNTCERENLISSHDVVNTYRQ